MPGEEAHFYTPRVSIGATTWYVATSPPKKRRVTINDVARKAGVNKGTVSRALRGMDGVGAETRARILAAAEELEYSASELGMALATGSTRTVGIVLPSLRSWYFSEVASGASDVLSNAGFRIELINLDIDSDFLQIDSEQFARLFRQLGAGRSRDALLFAGTTSIPEDGGRALVPVAAHGGPLATAPGVFVDHWEGGRLVAAHLTGLGHSALAMVDGRMLGKVDASIWEQRSAGFLAGVADSGLDPDTVRQLRPGDCRSADGEQIGKDLLASPDSLPSAVFCHSDELAFGLIASLRRGGVHCPQDISVAGFDDHPMAHLWDLTTVDQHAYAQGVRAAQALLGMLGLSSPDTEAQLPATERLSVELIIRDSTSPVPRSL
ncbi:LacI family transcriptional regulator [Microlunatus phosphovorus NM-1]|uniref:LacI family transcriptional regulator n=1 Tax=Microlunatus phosphovorus (strain ATCC 700054 / DSM 10555 / JCM 9379 / NBRC 101784 / NCIMB 13414 / VKM Ac-1990 / NM-1) TaxID=1032480 RepID=F5XMC0_MICPN|nr:LacI family transcriptional regulator [Microlunatus phosphovorus NM-1]